MIKYSFMHENKVNRPNDFDPMKWITKMETSIGSIGGKDLNWSLFLPM